VISKGVGHGRKGVENMMMEVWVEGWERWGGHSQLQLLIALLLGNLCVCVSGGGGGGGAGGYALAHCCFSQCWAETAVCKSIVAAPTLQQVKLLSDTESTGCCPAWGRRRRTLGGEVVVSR